MFVRCRRPLVALVAAVAVGAAALTGAAAEEFTLSILHTNDVHSRLDEVTVDGSRCRPADAAGQACFGGVARLATAIAGVRASQPNTLLVDAGDRFQGSLYYNTYKSAVLKPFFELLGYQAMTLGNHEFDDGPAELARFLDGLTVPVISANVDVSAEPLLTGRFGGTTVVTVGGQPVGLIGLTTPSTATSAKPGPNVHFSNPVAAAQAGVAVLQAQGVHNILVLSHLGEGEDEKLAAAVDGVAVIIGGHSHTLLRGSGDPRAMAPAPRVIQSPTGKPVLVVQAFFAGIYLGLLQVTLDDAGVPVRWQGEPLLLDHSVAQDATVRAFVDAFGLPLQAQIRQRLGEAAVDLHGGRGGCRFGECNLGNLIADAMVEQTAAQGTQIAIINGGGIRAGIPAGAVTLGQVLEVLPFANTISTFALTGADLRAALEYGVSRAENPANDGTGRFPQVAGLRYRWDAGALVGQRLLGADVRQPDGSWVALDDTVSYRCATIDYLRTGGDGYTVFRDRAQNPYDGGALLSDAVAAYLTAHTPVAPAEDGRITRVR
jgi:5'-nucleotidase